METSLPIVKLKLPLNLHLDVSSLMFWASLSAYCHFCIPFVFSISCKTMKIHCGRVANRSKSFKPGPDYS